MTAVPLSSRTDAAGVLTIYGADEVADPGTAQRATLFADATTALLREHTAVAELREREAQLRAALITQPIIDQAKGILMARNAFDADEAFAALRCAYGRGMLITVVDPAIAPRGDGWCHK